MRWKDYVLVLLLLLSVLYVVVHEARAADNFPLKCGSSGPRVGALQWLLGGHKPSVYRGIKTYRGKPSGYFGCGTKARTGRAVIRMKRRLGYPVGHLKPIAGRQFFAILTGKQKRPIGWIARAARRVSEGVPGASACARRAIGIARRELGYGVREIPDGSNWGSRVPRYLEAAGLNFRAPWCAAFLQFVFREAGYGTFANRSAGVFYIRDYARSRGWLRARPRAGALVAFLDRLGHIGLVERVTASGFWTIEGNASNAVRRRFHRIGPRPMVFIYLPRCT